MGGAMEFFLGTHQPGWLSRVDVPLCVSRRRLAGYKTLPRARGPWLLDSGGFTELSLHGRWTVSAADYVAEVRRYGAGVGHLALASPQDWMCEPDVRRRTNKTVVEHQWLTIDNLAELRALAPEVPWFPVLQGWTERDYLAHADAYARAGVDLTREPLVGVGTVCRRQHTAEAVAILAALAGRGLRLHGFGLKTKGLLKARAHLASADSMAWSYRARREGANGEPPWCGSTAHKNCANCRAFALHWRGNLLTQLTALHEGEG